MALAETMTLKADCLILGAGIVGICIALHLQCRGRSVVLVDRRPAGEETSFGNAGLIQREGIYPHGFPQDIRSLCRYAANRSIDLNYHLSTLIRIFPFLWEYRKQSLPATHHAVARSYGKLIEQSVSEHDYLIDKSHAQHLVRREGWIQLFRSVREYKKQVTFAQILHSEFGIGFRAVCGSKITELEPYLQPGLAGAIHWTGSPSISDPHALSIAFLKLFERLGGIFVRGDAQTLARNGERWSVQVDGTMQTARDAVIALGPWSGDLTRKLGYRFPLAVKRGYHMHYAMRGTAHLNHPVLDSESGYFLAPADRGIRLTTGVEFAARDAPPTPVQILRAEQAAIQLFPLGARLDETPWMGSRPCTPDMKPILGRARGHENLWFAFGHGHHGLTLGPITGRVLAELITGEPPIVDITPFTAERFG